MLLFVTPATWSTCCQAQEDSKSQLSVEASDGSSAETHQQDVARVRLIEQQVVRAIDFAQDSVVAVTRVPNRTQPIDRSRVDPLRLTPLTFEDLPTDPDYVPTFFGSGVIVDREGHIVTCAHVLGDPRKNDYYIWHADRSFAARVVSQPARVLAADPFSDLAVLKIDAPDLQPVTIGDAAKIRKGQIVISLGNPDAIARDGRPSASWGIVSNLGRSVPAEEQGRANGYAKETIHQYGTLIQTDARMSLGSSGGALLNLNGEMVGLTTSFVPSRSTHHAAGFAIATDKLFRNVVERLKAGKLPEFGFLGVQPDELRMADKQRGLHGARVSVVIQGMPGEKAGLKSDDIIVQVGEAEIYNRNDLFRELSKVPAGKNIDLVVQRFRLGSRVPYQTRLSARLSKKPVATLRPAYSVQQQTHWRGFKIDYATAVLLENSRAGLLGQSMPALAVWQVEPGSPSWTAGLRPGYGIVSIDGQSVQSPQQFEEMVSRMTGDVSMECMLTNGTRRRIQIPPSQSRSPSEISNGANTR